MLHGLYDADHRHRQHAGGRCGNDLDRLVRLDHPDHLERRLAFTGADIEEMAVIGVVAIGVGSVLVRGRRRAA